MPEKGILKQLQLRVLISVVGLLFFYSGVIAQKGDSIKASPQKLSVIGSDSLKAEKPHTKAHSPAKATIFSAILPGLGQAYNHKYWKIPIIYAGLGAMTYFIIFNQQNYNTFQTALTTRTNGGMDPYYNIYSASDLMSIRDSYHRYRDLSVIGAAVFYALNIVDAEVDAQLFTFNVSDDISMRLSPALVPTCNVFGITPGLSFTMKLK